MKTVAIGARGKDMDASVDQRFGRAPFFILIDPVTQEWEPFDNPANLTSFEDIGRFAAKSLTQNQSVETVITGNCGARAFQELQKAGVKIFLGAQGTVAQAFTNWRQSKLQAALAPNMLVFAECDDQGQ